MAGREPRAGRRRASWVWRLVMAQMAVLAVVVALAVHYRDEVGHLPHGGPSAAARPAASPLPELVSTMFRLPADGTVTGMVVITAAGLPGAGRAEFTVSAAITGGQPGTVYNLTGNDCSAVAPLPDHVWATGLTSANGTAELAGHAWTGAVADYYWLTLDSSPTGPPPGLHGAFAAAQATPFPAGQAPCAPPP